MLKDLTITGFVLLILDSVFLYSMSPLFKKQVEKVQQSHFDMNYFGAAFAYVLSNFWFVLVYHKGEPQFNRCVFIWFYSIRRL